MSARRPFFVVGCPRSGTTLTRVILDSHPELAVPPESHFVVPPRFAEDGASIEVVLERILDHGRFRRWELSPQAVRAAVAASRPASYPDLIRVVFATYARSRGKRRWGDKTPHYVYRLPELAGLFPEAQIVHVIRDGREVAASLVSQLWGPGSIVTAAARWRRAIVVGQRHGRRLGPDRYHELRLDRLIAAPEATVRELCDFLGEEFAPQMLEYQRDALSRLPLASRTGHSHITKPPTTGLRTWTDGVSENERESVEAICRRQLRRLGYPTAKPSSSAYLRAWSHLLRARWPERSHAK